MDVLERPKEPPHRREPIAIRRPRMLHLELGPRSLAWAPKCSQVPSVLTGVDCTPCLDESHIQDPWLNQTICIVTYLMELRLVSFEEEVHDALFPTTTVFHDTINQPSCWDFVSHVLSPVPWGPAGSIWEWGLYRHSGTAGWQLKLGYCSRQWWAAWVTLVAT